MELTCFLFQNTVITMLPGSGAVSAVYLDPNTGLLAGAVAAATERGEDSAPVECAGHHVDYLLGT